LYVHIYIYIYIHMYVCSAKCQMQTPIRDPEHETGLCLNHTFVAVTFEIDK